MTCLPHRKPTVESEHARVWQRTVGTTEYRLKSGCYDDGGPIGIPFGSKGRLILLYLHDEAVVHGSAAFPVAVTMHAWVRSMTSATGGMSYRQIGDQARRVAACRLDIREAGEEIMSGGRFVESVKVRREGRWASTPIADRAVGTELFPDMIVLDAKFHSLATRSTVRLRAAAIRMISDNSWAIDLYIWLAAYLPRQQAPEHLDWNMLPTYFGLTYKHPRQMRTGFIRALQQVRAIYPEARVEIDESGCWLWPSPPPI